MPNILGIDPGYGRTGVAILHYTNRQIPEAKIICTIETDKTITREKRYLQLYEELKKLVVDFSICCAAIENIFLKKNMKNMHYNIEARGVIIFLLTQLDIPINYYQPSSIKKALTGSGKAEKKQVQEMIKKLLKLDEVPKPDDSADAAALALTAWLHEKKYD